MGVGVHFLVFVCGLLFFINNIKKATVKEIVKGNRGYILRKNVMEDYPGKFQLYDGNIYAVKRVERKMTNSVRMYIRGLEA